MVHIGLEQECIQNQISLTSLVNVWTSFVNLMGLIIKSKTKKLFELNFSSNLYVNTVISYLQSNSILKYLFVFDCMRLWTTGQ